MSAARLIGLTAAAAECRDRDALDTAFEGLNIQEAEALGAAAGALLERQARVTGDWGAWAEIWWNARLPALQDAAARWRARLDAAANARSTWEIKARAQNIRHAEAAVRRVVRPLLRQSASKAAIEEAAGQAAGDAIDWQRIFEILCDEFDRAHQLVGAR